MAVDTQITVSGNYLATKYVTGKEYADLQKEGVFLTEVKNCNEHPHNLFLVSCYFSFGIHKVISIKDLQVFPSFIRFYYNGWCFELSLRKPHLEYKR
jgi:hypothetical protein